MRRPMIGISACLTGQAVRYDGNHKHEPEICEILARHFDLITFCPEMAIGMGAPRPPVHLVDINGAHRAIGIEDRSLDVSEALRRLPAMHDIAFNRLCGFVFKSRSPSCGLQTTPLHGPAGDVIGQTSGLFSREFLNAYPELVVCNETDLFEKAFLENFIEQVNRYFHQHM